MSPNGQPPDLGDVEIKNAGADGWQLWVKGTKACGGLTLPQVLQIIRGEFDVSALRRGEMVEHGNK